MMTLRATASLREYFSFYTNYFNRKYNLDINESELIEYLDNNYTRYSSSDKFTSDIFIANFTNFIFHPSQIIDVMKKDGAWNDRQIDENTMYHYIDKQFNEEAVDNGHNGRIRISDYMTSFSPEDLVEEVYKEVSKKYRRRNNPRKGTWMYNMKMLKSDYEEGINPVYEETESGSYIDDLSQQVENSLGVESQIDVQGGQGSIEFYDSEGIFLTDLDYQQFCDDIITIALNCSTKRDYISQLKQYYSQNVL